MRSFPPLAGFRLLAGTCEGKQACLDWPQGIHLQADANHFSSAMCAGDVYVRPGEGHGSPRVYGHNRMKALVLGGCGFIGSHVVDELLTRGHRVTVLDPSASISSWHNVTHYRCDLVERFALEKALSDVDVVYHLASATVPATSLVDPICDIEENLVGLVKVVEAMRRTYCRRLVYFSSGGAVYGESEASLIAEDHALEPISPYGVVKVAAEKYLGMCQRLYGLVPVIIRAANAYGPRQRKTPTQGLVIACISHLLAGEPIEVWGDGLNIRDFIYVKDLARLARIIGETNARSGVFNAGSGIGTSINEMVDIISGVCGRPPAVVRRPSRPFDVRRSVLSIDRAAQAFGWNPQINLRVGIRHTLDHLMTDHGGGLPNELIPAICGASPSR